MKNIHIFLVVLCFIQIYSSKVDTIRSWAKQRLGSGYYYCYGAAGEKLTQSLLNSLTSKFGASNVNPSKAKKHIGKIVYDCSGFVMMAFKQVGISINRSTTSAWQGTNWASKGSASSTPRDKMAILYRPAGSSKRHTGIYMGDGTVIHAKGIDYGIVKENFQPEKWGDYGIPRGLY
jgi:cell wall-associated NlpC family hydrolase